MRHNISVRVETLEVIFEACAALRRGSWRPVLRVFVRAFKPVTRGVQRLDQCINTRRFDCSQAYLSALQGADGRSADTGGFAQLRLREPGNIPEIGKRPILLRDGNQSVHRHSERSGNLSESVDLRCCSSGFPVAERSEADRCDSREIAPGEFANRPGSDQRGGVETFENSSRHSGHGISIVARRHRMRAYCDGIKSFFRVQSLLPANFRIARRFP